MCDHDWRVIGCHQTCMHCGIQGDQVFTAIIPKYGPQSYTRRFNVYSRTARFAEMLETAVHNHEDILEIMNQFYILHDNWNSWNNKSSRYFFNRRVATSYFIALYFKRPRIKQLKNQVSEQRQIKEIRQCKTNQQQTIPQSRTNKQQTFSMIITQCCQHCHTNH